jgi:hypothetical protein
MVTDMKTISSTSSTSSIGVTLGSHVGVAVVAAVMGRSGQVGEMLSPLA